jgi:hypothetical protein
MTNQAKKNTECRYCGSTDLTRFLSLGEQPPSNSFISPEQVESEESYPLDVYFCQSCYLVQLLDVVPAETIFDDYVYLSSSSKALKNHYAGLAEYITERFGLNTDDIVVDIGCNDGILLHGYQLPGLNRIGVEPSKVAEIVRESGLKVVNEFFSPETARHIVDVHGAAKVITATNVFAHVDNIGNFVEGVQLLLDNSGVFIIEAPYLIDMIDQILFDTIYHEHLCYLSLTPIIPFLARYNLEVFDVERVNFGASGPAIRVFVQKKPGMQNASDSVESMLEQESQWRIGKIDRYMGYAGKVESIRSEVLGIINGLKKTNVQIGGYGAPAKGNTLLNYFNITTEQVGYIAETNELKQGLLAPGSHIPIVSEELFLERMPEYALLLSWNYLDFFLEKSEYIQKGGRFIVPMPDPRIIP